MTPKLIRPRRRAVRDVEEALDRYITESGEAVELGFVEVLEKAYRHIAMYPDAGAARYAAELALPGLRFQPLDGYPYLVVYVDRPDHVDIWRVLHESRDIPAWLSGSHG